MRSESPKLLLDILEALNLLTSFVQDKNFGEYVEDVLLSSAVERQFEIIGEAVNQLSRVDPDTTSRISEFQRIIAFRNILIHGYAQVDNSIVWGLIHTRLPRLPSEVTELLDEARS